MTKSSFAKALKAQSVSFLRIEEPKAGSPEDIELGIMADATASYIESAIGKVPWDDKRVLYIGLIAMSDMYDTRDSTSNPRDESYGEFRASQQFNAAGRLVRNFILQIKAETRDEL